jgi:CheY-like chemotaxis protein
MSKENIKILIIDDDEDDTQLFIESAKEIDENIICVAARDGLEALQLLKNTDNKLPDYIFLDLRMPGFSGQKTLAEIKKETRLLHIPVIIYTTSRGLEESIELKKNGCCSFCKQAS